MVLACLVAAGLPCTLAAAQETILIKGGTIVNADQQFEADVYIKNGKIEAVAKGLSVASTPTPTWRCPSWGRSHAMTS